MMNLSFVGFLIKCLSTLAALYFGVRGIYSQKQSDSTVRLNKEGKNALVGLVIAGLLGISTNIYDFTSDIRKDIKEETRNVAIMGSIARGLYPLRDLSATFEIRIPSNGPIQDAFISQRLIPAIKADPDCETFKHRKREFTCFAHSYDITSGTSKTITYQIPSDSRIFPTKDTALYNLIKNISLTIEFFTDTRTHPEMIRKLTEIPTTQSADDTPWLTMGSVRLNWSDKMPSNKSLIYHSDTRELGIQIRNLPISGIATDVEAMSLLDILPGVIMASPDLSDDGFCDPDATDDKCHCASGESTENCDKTYDAVAAALTLERVELQFQFPKKIVLLPNQYDNTSCDKKLRGLLVALPDNVEKIDRYGEIIEQAALSGDFLCKDKFKGKSALKMK
jgi:hypothetical protein